MRVSTSNALFYIQAPHGVDTVRFTIRKPDTRVLLLLRPPSVFLSRYTRSLINDRGAPCASLRAEVTLAKGRKLGKPVPVFRSRERERERQQVIPFVAQRATARREGGLDEREDARVQGKHNSLPPPSSLLPPT